MTKEKIVIVTGGYGYLGGAMSELFAQRDFRVIVFGRNYNKFKDFAQGKSLNIEFFKGNIHDENSIIMLLEYIESKGFEIHSIINNAHSFKGREPLKIKPDEWNFTLEGSLRSVYLFTKIFACSLNSGSSIINISSMYGYLSPRFELYNNFDKFLNPPHYGAAKAGIIQLTKYFSTLLGPKGIRVNCISPGPIPKDSIKEESNEFIDRLSQRTVLKRVGTPLEIAEVAYFLASDKASYITGQNIKVDGGWSN